MNRHYDIERRKEIYCILYGCGLDKRTGIDSRKKFGQPEIIVFVSISGAWRQNSIYYMNIHDMETVNMLQLFFHSKTST